MMTETPTEQIHRASKKTRYVEIFYSKSPSKKYNGADLTEIFCMYNGDDKNYVIDFQIGHGYQGTTPINADAEDYSQVIKSIRHAIDDRTQTSTNFRKRIMQIVADFDIQHAERHDTDVYDTVDK